jgi:prepilin-type N-terminal cleavage/methylation domain-containing protein
MNKKTFTTKKKAFSLIELSIVLIIIGLLVAGVTGGSSLIKNAELRGLMTEARGYQTAVNAFNERFQALPGDFGSLIGGAFTLNASGSGAGVNSGSTGNNNNRIEFYAPGAAANTVPNRMESNIAWQQLKNGGFVDATVTPGSSDTNGGAYDTDLTPGTSIPGSKAKNVGWIFDFVGSQNVVIATASVVANIPANINQVAATATNVIVPIDALSIDTKIDDGLANDGKVRGHASTAGCNTAAAYTTATSTAACALSFQVDPGQ